MRCYTSERYATLKQTTNYDIKEKHSWNVTYEYKMRGPSTWSRSRVTTNIHVHSLTASQVSENSARMLATIHGIRFS